MRRFPKATNSHMIRFPKPLQTVSKNPQKISISAVFGNLFMWLSFGDPFMIALAAYGKWAQSLRIFIKTY
jgi:hypothetical protein